MTPNIFGDTAFFDIKWWICLDGKAKYNHYLWSQIDNKYFGDTYGLMCENNQSIAGNAQRNCILDHCKLKGWCIFIDDDNLIHPKFYWEFNRLLLEHQSQFGYRGYVFAQDRREDLGVVLEPLEIGVGYKKTDSSQYVVHSDIIGNTRWKIDDYNADGLFIEEIYNKNKEKFYLSNTILSLRNALIKL